MWSTPSFDVGRGRSGPGPFRPRAAAQIAAPRLFQVMRFADAFLALVEALTAVLALVGIAVSLPVLGDPYYDQSAAWHVIAIGLALLGLAGIMVQRAVGRVRSAA